MLAEDLTIDGSAEALAELAWRADRALVGKVIGDRERRRISLRFATLHLRGVSSSNIGASLREMLRRHVDEGELGGVISEVLALRETR